jgi:wobble nucleotide-excising tRNase
METKIIIKNCATYKKEEKLESDKRFNFIYGLNGSGKTTISMFLQKKDMYEEKYKDCSIECTPKIEDYKFLIYNQQFVTENFYDLPSQKGIFSLSKENKEAKEEIDKANKETENLKTKKAKEEEDKKGKNDALSDVYKTCLEEVWAEKEKNKNKEVYDFFEGYKNDKKKLLDKLINLEPDKKTLRDIKDINTEIEYLSSHNSDYIEIIRLKNFDMSGVEKNEIWQKQIVGSKNSSFSELLEKLGNSDWVKNGKDYVNKDSDKCPFCQQPIEGNHLQEELTNYFDETYSNDILTLSSILEKYKTYSSEMTECELFNKEIILKEIKNEYQEKYHDLRKLIEENLTNINKKKLYPSIQVSLEETSSAFTSLNEVINRANTLIADFNKKVDNKKAEMEKLNQSFWNSFRCSCDGNISKYLKKKKSIELECKKIQNNIDDLDRKIIEQKKIITNQQKNVINVQESIDHINLNLVNLGIDGFQIEKAEGDLYEIRRKENKDEKVFRTLSEGEKTMISFLYFVELCKGKGSANEAEKKKIVVIDDPISSMSNQYIFNVSCLIKQEFLGKSSDYAQMFVLTHNLYFFTEIRKNVQNKEDDMKMFRIYKNEEGSHIKVMQKDEIQNDYQSYWSIIKDPKCPPIMMANCMRHIVEYFFGFVTKQPLKILFSEKKLDVNSYKAFYRYINRESHSDIENISDFKDFDYDEFKKCFQSLFIELGYEEHYKKMMNDEKIK